MIWVIYNFQVRTSSISSMRQPTWKMQAYAWPAAKCRTSWFQNHAKSWMLYFFINLFYLNFTKSTIQFNRVFLTSVIIFQSKATTLLQKVIKSIFKKQKFVFFLPSQLGSGGGGTAPVESAEFPPTSSLFPSPSASKKVNCN